MWENRVMNQTEHFSRKSILNWFGLGLLGLLVFGLLRMAHNDQPVAEPKEVAGPASIAQDLSSPLPAALLSPISAVQESPLPSPTTALELAARVPSPTAPSPTRFAEPGFHLTVLHTNDTWGYLNPCG
jgi:hypothetical protein